MKRKQCVIPYAIYHWPSYHERNTLALLEIPPSRLMLSPTINLQSVSAGIFRSMFAHDYCPNRMSILVELIVCVIIIPLSFTIKCHLLSSYWEIWLHYEFPIIAKILQTYFVRYHSIHIPILYGLVWYHLENCHLQLRPTATWSRPLTGHRSFLASCKRHMSCSYSLSFPWYIPG